MFKTFKMLKIFCIALLSILIMDTTNEAWAQGRNYHYVDVIAKKAMSVGKNTNSLPDSSAWLEIGEDSSTRSAILFHPTDTSLIDTTYRKFGTIILQESDSSFYMDLGDAWRRLKWTDE